MGKAQGTHPDLFEEAKQYEYAQLRYARENNENPFYWSGDEPLEQLERPERVEEIKRKWELSQQKRKQSSDKLVQILGNAEMDDDEREGCLICQI